jgi:hypothetical protein
VYGVEGEPYGRLVAGTVPFVQDNVGSRLPTLGLLSEAVRERRQPSLDLLFRIAARPIGGAHVDGGRHVLA